MVYFDVPVYNPQHAHYMVIFHVRQDDVNLAAWSMPTVISLKFFTSSVSDKLTFLIDNVCVNIRSSSSCS